MFAQFAQLIDKPTIRRIDQLFSLGIIVVVVVGGGGGGGGGGAAIGVSNGIDGVEGVCYEPLGILPHHLLHKASFEPIRQ